MLRVSIIHTKLRFRTPAGTSRGVYLTRPVWYVVLSSTEEPTRWGIGECAPLPDLSIDAVPDYEAKLNYYCRYLQTHRSIPYEELLPYPSILFGLETAWQHYQQGSFRLWDTAFSRGEAGIPINGLIWMGDYPAMLKQIEAKIQAGYRCIKLKIGAIHFEEELALLRFIRRHFPAQEMELRVDANGAFSPEEASEKLKRLAELDIHSIEQPIRAGQWETMAKLIAQTPLPIALDEELIGTFSFEAKQELLDTLRPQYIILKPSLHGGIRGCEEWIAEANQREIGWWVTSALESNVGLNAIAQWTATHSPDIPQGLGTGLLFEENFPMPLSIRGDRLWFNPQEYPQTFLSEWFDPRKELTIQTSGSTGTPKQLSIKKKHMEQSALNTLRFFGLKPGDKALLCMPMEYIAGKMMIVRSLIGQLNLIIQKPSSHPLAELVDEPLRFIAMTPMQVYNALQVPEEAERLRNTEVLIIGGSSIEPELEKELESFPHQVYSTYGMTETVSHIALRKLNGKSKSDYYIPLPGVRLSLSEENTLRIEAPFVSDEILTTNDIVELNPDGSFRILGRKDNVINSGSIKIQVEEIEQCLRSVILVDFAITSVPDPQFGEAMTLLIYKGIELEALQAGINRLLPSIKRPKHIFIVEQIPRTATGKIDRKSCKELAFHLSSK